MPSFREKSYQIGSIRRGYNSEELISSGAWEYAMYGHKRVNVGNSNNDASNSIDRLIQSWPLIKWSFYAKYVRCNWPGEVYTD